MVGVGCMGCPCADSESRWLRLGDVECGSDPGEVLPALVMTAKECVP